MDNARLFAESRGAHDIYLPVSVDDLHLAPDIPGNDDVSANVDSSLTAVGQLRGGDAGRSFSDLFQELGCCHGIHYRSAVPDHDPGRVCICQV